MFERKKGKEKDQRPPEGFSALSDAALEAVEREIVAAEAPAEPRDPDDPVPFEELSHHKYKRDGKGGWVCALCRRTVADPSLIGIKDCPGK